MRNLVHTLVPVAALALTAVLASAAGCAAPKQPMDPAMDRERKLSEVWQYKHSDGDTLQQGLWDTPGVRVPGNWDYTPVITDEQGQTVPFDPAKLPWHDAEILDLEKRLVAEINRLRRNPPSYRRQLSVFASFYQDRQVVIPGQLTIQTAEGAAAAHEAIDFVRDVEPLPPIQRSPLLDRAALVHAADLHDQPRFSHLGSDGSQVIDRIVHHGVLHGAFAELISAGYNAADLMILQLVTDDGVASRANRVHLLSPMFRQIGVACAPHDGFRVVCVIEMANAITPKVTPEDQEDGATGAPVATPAADPHGSQAPRAPAVGQ